MKPLLVILPFHSGDFQLALGLLQWIRDLGSCKGNHPLLIIGSKRALNVEMLRLKQLAETMFAKVVTERAPGLPDESWPRGANIMFRHACELVEKRYRAPFLWMEPDCVPLKPGWLDAIATEYETCGHSFMGGIRRQTSNPGLPETYLPGCSVYPMDAFTRLRPHWEPLSTAWDVSTAAVTIPSAVKSMLFYEWWGMNGKPPMFRLGRRTEDPPEVMVPDQIPKQAVFFHRSKDGSLIECLRSKSVINPDIGRPTRFYHSGDLGDIIYSLLFASTFGEIELFLGPDCKHRLRDSMTRTGFNWLAPLLRSQPWIKTVEFSERNPGVDYCLNDFRDTWFSPGKGHDAKWRLFETYARHFSHPIPDESKPWLSVDPITNSDRPVVISRTSRYRDHSNYPWPEAVSRYGGKMRFVGYDHEYRDWVDSFGNGAEYVPVVDALHMARIIGGAELFIGNQSFPMALALALNASVVQEVDPNTPDCIFRRPNAIYSNSRPLILPVLKSADRRLVATRPAKDGLIELGPCADAFGLGDTLTVTPLALRLGKRAVMCIPKTIARFADLFLGLCETRITDDGPVFPATGQRFIESKLRQFGFNDFQDGKVLPVLRLKDSEIQYAKDFLRPSLDSGKPLVIMVTRCAAEWSKIRSRPKEFFLPIVAALSKHFQVVQLPDTLPLRELAACYHVAGHYCGVNTGNWHLAQAIGCRCLVMESESVPGYDPALWRYAVPSCEYVGFDIGNVIAKIPWLLA